MLLGPSLFTDLGDWVYLGLPESDIGIGAGFAFGVGPRNNLKGNINPKIYFLHIASLIVRLVFLA